MGGRSGAMGHLHPVPSLLLTAVTLITTAADTSLEPGSTVLNADEYPSYALRLGHTEINAAIKSAEAIQQHALQLKQKQLRRVSSALHHVKTPKSANAILRKQEKRTRIKAQRDSIRDITFDPLKDALKA